MRIQKIPENPNYTINEFGVLTNTTNGKIVKWSKSKKGYLKCSIIVNNKQKELKLHRILALSFLENPNNYPCINHIDGNKLNNSLENLEWCTFSHNITHAYRLGLITRKKKFSKETEDEILFLYNNTGMSQPKLAEKYNTTSTHIYLIIKRYRATLWLEVKPSH